MAKALAPQRPRRISCYQRFMDWLWFGPLTRDLRPALRPSRLRAACALLADICRSGWSLVLPGPERSRRAGR